MRQKEDNPVTRKKLQKALVQVGGPGKLVRKCLETEGKGIILKDALASSKDI
jgi:hypothetical protein